jgi:predicted 2-oxoglutarate/Fe(II)-dependent dioxygenase YbiX/peroxiredoxin
MHRQSHKLERGDAAPWFRGNALSGVSNYQFNVVGGRHILMLFFSSAAEEPVARALALVRSNRATFDDQDASFFGITCDPADVATGRIARELPGIRFFLDYERVISDIYGLAHGSKIEPKWFVLDEALRILDTFPVTEGERALALLRSELVLRSPDPWAPVLKVPNVFSKEFCQRLIREYDEDGGHPSGFMRDVDGKTVLVVDNDHKQRRDYLVADQGLRSEIAGQIARHLSIPIRRAFQFRPTRIERYVVACYEAGAGHFRPHRDNTTAGTAHRKFAVTINLNAEEFDGGDLRFPEFGSRTYRAPTGGAIVFSCSLLHEATPVTNGRRLAFLPFLYDEEAARLRESNNPHLGENLSHYTKD